MIEASFAQQYSIRLRYENEMKWGEFCALLAGLNDKTPLGKMVSIRAENDPKVLKSFTREQKEIRSAWRKRSAKQVSPENYADAMRNFESMFLAMAGKEGDNGR